MLSPQPLHYVVAYRETRTSAWRRGGDHTTFALAREEARDRGQTDLLSCVLAAWPTEESMDAVIARLNTPPRAEVTTARPPGINYTVFTDWWRKLDEALAMLEELPATLGEAHDYFIAEVAPSMAAIQLRAMRIKVRKLESRS